MGKSKLQGTEERQGLDAVPQSKWPQRLTQKNVGDLLREWVNTQP